MTRRLPGSTRTRHTQADWAHIHALAGNQPPTDPALCRYCQQRPAGGQSGMCNPCRNRWARRDFAGDGPDGPTALQSIDEIALERALSDRVPDCDVPALNPAERRAATALLTARGWPAWRIAERLSCTPRSVVRYRATNRATGAP